MVVVTSSDGRYKIIGLTGQGWYFYSPPITNPAYEFFVSIDDHLAFQVAELLKLTPEAATRNQIAAEVLLEKLINLKSDRSKINNRPTAAVAI